MRSKSDGSGWFRIPKESSWSALGRRMNFHFYSSPKISFICDCLLPLTPYQFQTSTEHKTFRPCNGCSYADTPQLSMYFSWVWIFPHTPPNSSCNYSRSDKCSLWCQTQTNSSPRSYHFCQTAESCSSTQDLHKHALVRSFTKCWVASIRRMICIWLARVSFMWRMIAFIIGDWRFLGSGSVFGGWWIRFRGRRVFQKVSWREFMVLNYCML